MTPTVDVGERDATVVQKAQEAIAFLKSVGWEPSKREQEQPKTWFVDPFQLMDSMGLGYRQTPGPITYDTLLQMTERDPVIASIIQTRVQQAISFMRPQANKYSVGFIFRRRDVFDKSRLSDGDKKRIKYLTNFVLNTGREYNRDRDDLEMFVKKFVRDSLTYDQATFEKNRGLAIDYGKPGKLISFTATPSASMRIAYPKHKKGTPLRVDELRKTLKYVQVVNGKNVEEYTSDELAFCVRNPRTDISVYGYGYTELEMLLNTVTAHLWAEEWNRKQFSNGATLKGLLNVKGNIPNQQLEAFKRQWAMQAQGVWNAHRTPIMNAEGVEWFPLQLSNTEMGYQMWLEYLIKIACACYQMDPSEINFDLRGGAGVSQPMFMTTNEAQQKLSKDRGLRPLLRFIAASLNRHIIWEIDPRYELDIVGLDAKSEEAAIELRLKEVQNYKTVNEVRAEDDLPPIPAGDIVLNPTFTGYKQQMEMAQQQGGAMGQGGMSGQPAPQSPGAPGGAGGMQAAPPQSQPVEQRPNALQKPDGQPHPYEDTEHGAANVIQQKIAQEESSEEERSPGEEDWESSKHASLNGKKSDLRKSVIDFSDYFMDV